jgi:hypothetical protein
LLWSGASKYYNEALKQGTSESLMSLTTGSVNAKGVDAATRIVSAMGPVDEKVGWHWLLAVPPPSPV